jgi:hypothetical protein
MSLLICCILNGVSWGNTLEQLGHLAAFESSEQVVKLKKLMLDHPGDSFIALTWSISSTDKSSVESLIFYDRKAKTLWRAKSIKVGAERMEPKWIGWTDVTDDKIQSLKNEDGFELPGFHTGSGPIPLADDASAFLKKALGKKIP